KPHQGLSQRDRQLCQVDSLEPVAGRLEWRVSRWQKGPEKIDVILWPDPVFKGREGDRDLPADILPVCAGSAELAWLRTLPAIGLGDADGRNSRVCEREDEIAGRDFTH